MNAEEKDNTIRKVYFGKEGGRTVYKTYVDAKAIDPQITLDWVKGWFDKNVNRTRQVSGTKNSFVAPRAYHEYEFDLLFITDKQFPNQDFPICLSMIDISSKFAVGIPLKERDAPNVMAGIFKAFKMIGKQPEILYSDDEGALTKKGFLENSKKREYSISQPQAQHML